MKKFLLFVLALLIVNWGTAVTNAAIPRNFENQELPVKDFIEGYFVVFVSHQEVFSNVETNHVKYYPWHKVLSQTDLGNGMVVFITKSGKLQLTKTNNPNIFWAAGKPPSFISANTWGESTPMPPSTELIVLTNSIDVPQLPFLNTIYLSTSDIEGLVKCNEGEYEVVTHNGKFEISIITQELYPNRAFVYTVTKTKQ